MRITWTASTDNVGVTGYKVYRNGGQVGTSTTTAYTDTGLSPETTYSYTVSAYDVAGNNSAQSSPPAVGTTLAQGAWAQWLWEADNHSGDSGAYSSLWTDGVHNFTESRTSGGWYWSWNDPAPSQCRLIGPGTEVGRSWLQSNEFGEDWSVDTGITVAARVRPVTVSGWGNVMLSANNSSTADLNSAEDPGATSTHVWVGWDAGDQVVFVTRSGNIIKQFTSSVPFTDTWCIWTLAGQQIGTTMAWDLWINGVWQDKIAQASDGSYHTLVWSKSTDMGTSVVIGQRRSQSFAHDTIWDYVGVTNFGVVPGWDGISPVVSDTQPPSVPSNVQAAAQSPTSILVTWTASTDNVGVTGYKVYRNGSQVGTPTTTSYTDTGLSPNTTYSYTVSAYDAVGNNSAQSSPPAVATTPAQADTTPPSVPTSVQATAQSSTSIQVTWTASTDNVGVTGYRVYRNGSEVGTSAVTVYNDSGLQSGVTYSYTVSAYDAAGNNSAQSTPPATATTPDAVVPSVPSDVQAVAQTPKQVKLSWTASTDNVGVAGYKIYRNGVQIGTSAGTEYTDSDASPGTTYSYTVSAYDAAGNESAQSAPAQVTTMAAMDIATAKALPNGASVGLLDKIVSSVFDDCIYVLEPDRYMGIKIVSPQMPSGLFVGRSVDVGGTLLTDSQDERYIQGFVKAN